MHSRDAAHQTSPPRCRPLPGWLFGLMAAATALTGAVLPPFVDESCPFCLWGVS